MKPLLKAALVSAALSLSIFPALAQQTGGGGASSSSSASSTGNSDNQCDYKTALAKHESGGRTNVVNSLGYAGKYQFGESALIDAGYKTKGGGWTGRNNIKSMASFLASPAAQEDAQARFQVKQDEYAAKHGLNQYLGKPIPGCGKNLTQEGLRAAIHLVGTGGAKHFLSKNGECSGPALDGKPGWKRRTCAGTYMCNMSGCQEVKKDMSKETCKVTMPMIDAISCSNFPANLQSFCQQTLPHRMTSGECKAAESWAKRAPMGPNKEACENMSFTSGTGSWSFVLACSYAKERPADGDGKAKTTGPTKDPQCIQKLKGMGVQFTENGQMSNGAYGGRTCIIESAVTLRGTAVPFGANLPMTCDMAIAMEQFGQKLRGLGVTGYYGIGSTRPCGPMRDKTGNKPGTITEHALGRAVDFSGVIVGGRRVSMGAIHNPGTADGALATQIKSLACSTFKQTLSPQYAKYAGTFVHFHVEWGPYSNCK